MADETAVRPTTSVEDATVGRPSRWRRFLNGVDERLGLKGLQYGVPEHANKLAYSLGGLSLFTFVVMVVTGIVLTQYYNPSPGRAHQSVHDIVTSVTLGKFVRGLHYWGAMAMVVLVGLHLLRVFVSGSFKRPREGNWTIGVILAATTAALFFTGSRQMGPRGLRGARSQHRDRQTAGPVRLLVLTEVRRHLAARATIRRAHRDLACVLHGGRNRAPSAGQVPRDGAIAVPQERAAGTY